MVRADSMFSPHTSDTSVGVVQTWDVSSLKTIKPQYMAASLPSTLHSQTCTIFQILFTHNWCVEFWAVPKETDGPFRLHDEAGHAGLIKLYHFNFNQLLGLLVQKSVESQRLNLGEYGLMDRNWTLAVSSCKMSSLKISFIYILCIIYIYINLLCRMTSNFSVQGNVAWGETT